MSFSADPQAEGFTPYESLTEDIVIGWVTNALGDSLAGIEASLQARIDEEKNPTTSTGMPWAN